MKRNAVCFYLTPSEFCKEALRRYAEGECPDTNNLGYHNHAIVIGRLKTSPLHSDDFPHDDPRWPTHCTCGYEFKDADGWQHNRIRLYSRSDTGELTTLRDAPPGAMWDAHWYPENYRGPDGRSLMIMLPNNREWLLDHPDGRGWKRSGEPPKVTAMPSVWSMKGHDDDWHGFLRNGVLEEC